jgi:hypothetical protein
MRNIARYGITFDADSVNDVAIELWMIQHGGRWRHKDGNMVGEGLFFHYRQLQTILWPEDDHHDWSDLILKSILENRITVVQGPKDCSKTRTMAKYALTDYFCFPHETLILLSSTDIRGLELRVWGDIKDLIMRARQHWPEAPGVPIDSLHGIFTDGLDENNDVRDIRKGILGIPTIESNGQWKGMEKFVGIKQKRRRLCGDEVALMKAPYLTSLANLNKIGSDFKGVFVGNPIGENDPLDKLAEPEGGWDSLGEVTKTTTWKNRMGGLTIQLVGTDSPAIRFPGQYPYLIDQSDVDYIKRYWGEDSAEYWNQAAGLRRPGAFSNRVVTRDLCVQFGAMDDVVWGVKPTVKLYALDAGYGGDRCIGGWGEFGQDINGTLVLNLGPHRIIPIKVYPTTVPEKDRKSPEDQIAVAVRQDCEGREGGPIPASHVFYDATGRGSMGTAFARLWSSAPVPLEFGGSPTKDPVCADLYKEDEATGERRLVRCDEHFSKRVTQYWFRVRYTIEGGQMRGLTQPVIDELCARKWHMVRGDKKEVEPKEETKEVLGRSPDIGDWAAILVEGAIRLGFVLSRLTIHEIEEEDAQWKWRLKERGRRMRQSYTLDLLPG